MKIRDMELVVRVAETGSMTVAAKQLHLTPAAVSAAVQRIEGAIGVRLFERTTRSLHPTDEGLVIVDAAREVVERWQRALEAARDQRGELEGEIHLSAPADTTYMLLEPLVAKLCAAHPKLRVVLVTSDALLHLHRESIDMAIRYGALADSTLVARKLVVCPRVLVASPAYLDAHGTPEVPEDLLSHRCLTLQLGSAPVSAWELQPHDGRVQTLRLDSPLCGDGYLVRRWAIAGMGIAFKSLFDVIEDLEAGRLVVVLPEYTGGNTPIHALFPSRRFQTARVRALHDLVLEVFAARAAQCEAWIDEQTL